MAEKKKVRKTPLLDELDKGPWPSFVKEFKTLQEKKDVVDDLLGQSEHSYETKIGYWKHGGIVGVMGYGGGVIGRYSALPDKFPAAKHFHTMRIIRLAGFTPQKPCAAFVISGRNTVRVSPICTVRPEISSF